MILLRGQSMSYSSTTKSQVPDRIFKLTLISCIIALLDSVNSTFSKSSSPFLENTIKDNGVFPKWNGNSANSGNLTNQ